MDTEVKYQGIVATAEQIAFVKELIASDPNQSRRRLSKRLCEAWGWVQPNGQLRDMVCRGFLLQLHRAGYIELPAKKHHPPNPLARRSKPAPISVDESPMEGSVAELGRLDIVQVRGTPAEKMFNSLIEEYHYLGYCHPVGEALKYIVVKKGRPIACFTFCSAPRHIGCRDRYIGWNQQQRKKNLHLIAYNQRFLIMPWVGIPNLASHLLGRIAREVSEEWQKLYNHGISLLTTFVDTERFCGGCYRASNWEYLGKTTGRGKNDQTNTQNRSIKAVWAYPLSKDFRRRLCGGE